VPKVGMEPLRRKALIDATISAIGERGSLDVTMSEIAGRAGVSSALAHHYFGAKDELLQATMRHLLSELGTDLRAALHMAATAHERVLAVIAVNFSDKQFRAETIAAWLAFYVEAQKSPAMRRLLRVYARRLHSNLMSGLSKLMPRAEADHAAAHHHAPSGPRTGCPAALAAAAGCLATRPAPPSAGGLRPGRSLFGDDDVGGNRLEVEHLADVAAQRHDQSVHMHRPAGGHLSHRGGGEFDLGLGTEQHDVGQGRLDRIAHAPGPLEARGAGRSLVGLCCTRREPQVAQVRWVHRQSAGEGAAERLVGGDERLQPLVDLAVLPFAPLLQRHHHHKPDAHADQRDQQDSGDGGRDRLPGTEVEKAHAIGPVGGRGYHRAPAAARGPAYPEPVE